MSVRLYTITLPWFRCVYNVFHDRETGKGCFVDGTHKITRKMTPFHDKRRFVFTISKDIPFGENNKSGECSEWFFRNIVIEPFTRKNPFYLKKNETHITKNAREVCVLRGPNAIDLSRIFFLYLTLQASTNNKVHLCYSTLFLRLNQNFILRNTKNTLGH